jgi:hypothetical protein
LCKLLSVYVREYQLNLTAFEHFIFQYYLDVELKKSKLDKYHGSKQHYCIGTRTFCTNSHFNGVDQFSDDLLNPPSIRRTKPKGVLLDRLESLLPTIDNGSNLPLVSVHDPEQTIFNTPVESSKESQLAEEIKQLVSERKTLLEVKRTDILNNFLLKVVNPNIYALDMFWARGASIESLQTELFNASLQLKELREETMQGI